MTDIDPAPGGRRRNHAHARGAWVTIGLLVLGACSDTESDDEGTPAGGSQATPMAGAPAAAGVAGGTSASDPAGMTPSGGAAGSTAAGGSMGSAGAAGAAGAAGMAGAAGAAGAAGGAGVAAGAGGAPAAERPPASSLSLPTLMESGGAEPWFNVYRPMDLTATGQLLPVIVWANGGCFRSDFTWAPLFERWAAGGFVVLALTESPTEGALVQTTVEHHGALIDWALEEAEFAGMLDPERIVAAGNSCGGITALGLAAEDDRVSAVFVLSGSSAIGGANTAVIDAITVPVGYVVGGAEDIAGANASADYDALGDGIPAMIVSRSSGDHVTVSTDETVLPQVAAIGLDWMDLALYGTAEAAEALTSSTVCAGCDAGTWTLKSKHLETLQQ